jgi:hypothetical protein
VTRVPAIDEMKSTQIGQGYFWLFLLVVDGARNPFFAASTATAPRPTATATRFSPTARLPFSLRLPSSPPADPLLIHSRPITKCHSQRQPATSFAHLLHPTLRYRQAAHQRLSLPLSLYPCFLYPRAPGHLVLVVQARPQARLLFLLPPALPAHQT